MTHSIRTIIAIIGGLGIAISGAAAAPPAANVSHYDHIFLVVDDRHDASQIIGSPDAPKINSYASTYGLASLYFSVVQPSPGAYVAMLGGDTFGIADDLPYINHVVSAPGLLAQLESIGLTWKGYFQSIPNAGYTGFGCGMCLYVSKHNPIIYFAEVEQDQTDVDKMVPDTQLKSDLANPPNFALIIPDQCHDMHSHSGPCAKTPDSLMIQMGDAYFDNLAQQIMAAPFWAAGNNAIILTFGANAVNNGLAGCCDANNGGGQVATIVITSRGPRGLVDSNAYNHYSLLQTIQGAFSLPCLGFTCDTLNVKPMAALFQH
jgi:hypothetical protein